MKSINDMIDRLDRSIDDANKLVERMHKVEVEQKKEKELISKWQEEYNRVVNDWLAYKQAALEIAAKIDFSEIVPTCQAIAEQDYEWKEEYRKRADVYSNYLWNTYNEIAVETEEFVSGCLRVGLLTISGIPSGYVLPYREYKFLLTKQPFIDYEKVKELQQEIEEERKMQEVGKFELAEAEKGFLEPLIALSHKINFERKLDMWKFYSILDRENISFPLKMSTIIKMKLRFFFFHPLDRGVVKKYLTYCRPDSLYPNDMEPSPGEVVVGPTDYTLKEVIIAFAPDGLYAVHEAKKRAKDKIAKHEERIKYIEGLLKKETEEKQQKIDKHQKEIQNVQEELESVLYVMTLKSIENRMDEMIKQSALEKIKKLDKQSWL